MNLRFAVFTKLYRRLLWHLRRIRFRPWRLFRRPQPSLHSRITTVFLISFVVFITVAGSSLLLVFNYQLHRYTQFVGHQYAVQLNRLLGMYYDAKKSWQGVDGWLLKNFASDAELDNSLLVAQKDGGQKSGDFKGSKSPPDSRQKTLQDYVKTKQSGTLALGLEQPPPHRAPARRKPPRHRPHPVDFASIVRASASFLLPHQQSTEANMTLDWELNLAYLPMFANQDFIGAGTDKQQVGGELFFFHRGEMNNALGHGADNTTNRGGAGGPIAQNTSQPPNFRLYFLGEPEDKNLIVSNKLLGTKYLNSSLLSFCLVDPFCSVGEDALTGNSPLDRSLTQPQPTLDQWFRTFFRQDSFDSNELGKLNGEALQSLLRERGFSSWVRSEDRPDLFAGGKQFESDNLLSRLQLRYMSTHQMFVLFDPSSQVIASSLPEDMLTKELGSAWPRLQKYIADYKPNATSVPDSGTRAGSVRVSETLSSPFNSFIDRPSLLADRNIFVINDKSNNPVGFLYAESIVSPIWKNLNSEVNTVIVKIALLSCLVIAMIYWLIDRFHLRKLFMPLRKLSDIAAEVRKGNTKARVQEIPKEAELALVTEQFNKMLDSQAHEVMLREQQYRDVAHELRTPITIISGELQLIEEGVYQADGEKIQGLINQVHQMQRIVQDLEILYKVSHAGDKSLGGMICFDQVSASQLLNEAFTAFQTQMKQKKISFSLDWGSLQEAAEVYVQGDSRRLHQVFANCLVNAMRYTPAGGQIEIAGCLLLSAELNDAAKTELQVRDLNLNKDYVLFSVADSGCGIPAEKRELVFERFFRVDDDRNYKSGGSGLGLAISKSFIELHGGAIWVEESHLQQLPAIAEEGGGEEAPASEVERAEPENSTSPGAKFCFILPCSQAAT